jgi:hypothetical protein
MDAVPRAGSDDQHTAVKGIGPGPSPKRDNTSLGLTIRNEQSKCTPFISIEKSVKPVKGSDILYRDCKRQNSNSTKTESQMDSNLFFWSRAGGDFQPLTFGVFS